MVSSSKRDDLTGSPPRRQAKKKTKKPHNNVDEDTDTTHHIVVDASRDPNSLVLEKRLFSARTTKRLDLSIAAHRSNERLPHQLVPFQVFPRAIVTHEHLSGHHLQELWLTNHHLSVLPADIALFPQLRVLGLAGNALSSLPPEVTELTALEALYLERNAFHMIPDNVIFPRQLRDLRLDHNELTAVPLQLTRLRLLQRLGLSHNRLTSLPIEMRRLVNLVELDLDHNGITSQGFPNDAIVWLSHLERIGLDGNQLSERPSCLRMMPTERYVRLNGNRGFSSSNSVPRRCDGYYQCVQSDGVAGGSEMMSTPLDGLVPSHDQNVINAMTYRSPF